MRDRTTSAERRRRREARSAAVREKALALRNGGATYQEIGAALGLSSSRVAQIIAKAKRLVQRPQWHSRLTARGLNLLAVRGLANLPEIEAARAISALSRRELMSEPNIGRGACDALYAWLRARGLALRNESLSEKTGGFRGRPTHFHDPFAPGRRAVQCTSPITRIAS